MSYIFHNIGWKILSVVVAFCLWFIVVSSNNLEVSKEVRLDLDLPPGLVVANEMPEKVTFRLSGSKFFLRTIANSLDVIKIDLSHAKAGPTYYRFERDSLRLPIGVKVLSISPSSISPVLETMKTKTVPVLVETRNQLPSGYRLVKIVADPPAIRIRGPRSAIDRIDQVRPAPLDLSDISQEMRWEVPLLLAIPNVAVDEEKEPRYIVEIEPLGSNFRVAGIPLTINAQRKFTSNIDKVAIYVNCPPAMLKSLSPDKVVATVEVPEKKTGSYKKEVKVSLPAGVKLIRVVPPKVDVRLE